MKRISMIVALLFVVTAGLFSQNERAAELKGHLITLTSDSLKGRAAGTEGERMAARYIERVFKESDIELLYPSPGQDFSFVNDSGDTLKSQNIVGIIEGYDPELKNEYILVGAHYDHLGSIKTKINGKDSLLLYKGADDNASGVAVMLEVAKMVRARNFLFKRSVIIAAFGAEERGMIGSWYFANRAFQHKEKISLMVNLDMLGRGGAGRGLYVYTMMPHTELTTLLKDASDKPLMPSPTIKTSSYFPSDHQVFAADGIPVALFTTGLHRDYHTNRDVEEEIDYVTMDMTTEYVFNLILDVANMGRMLSRTLFAPQEEIAKESGKARIYKQEETEIPAQFLHGREQRFLDRWVYKYLKYPQGAVDRGVSGRVIVEFTIDHEGKVKDVEVIKSLDYELDEAALKTVEASPDWKPAKIDGKPVSVRIALPVEFRLKR
ncbi:MAG: TonB family protein [Bacteroidales bacterium]|jgi:TonB family protein|nr:TonB family protein [Bacteroidales bacterium]MDD4057540.1 TonB family protein [Bacteroidales bacterium]